MRRIIIYPLTNFNSNGDQLANVFFAAYYVNSDFNVNEVWRINVDGQEITRSTLSSPRNLPFLNEALQPIRRRVGGAFDARVGVFSIGNLNISSRRTVKISNGTTESNSVQFRILEGGRIDAPPVNLPAPQPVGSPSLPTAAPPPSNAPTTYTVKAGDNLSLIARRFGITVDDLVNANEDVYPTLRSNPNLIQIGWVLKIVPNAPRQTTPRPTTAQSSTRDLLPRSTTAQPMAAGSTVSMQNSKQEMNKLLIILGIGVAIYLFANKKDK